MFSLTINSIKANKVRFLLTGVAVILVFSTGLR